MLAEALTEITANLFRIGERCPQARDRLIFRFQIAEREAKLEELALEQQRRRPGRPAFMLEAAARDIGFDALAQGLEGVLCCLPDVVSIKRSLQFGRSGKRSASKLLRFANELVDTLLSLAGFLPA